MIDLIIIVVFLTIAYVTGTAIEKKHLKSLREREIAIVGQPYVVDQFKTEDMSDVEKTEFVSGSCVIAADNFKVFFGGLLSIFGGRISAYETLTDRARREAILRMRENAMGADAIICTRIQCSEVGKSQVEAIAYGTAIFLPKESKPVDPESDEELQAYAF